MVATDRDDQFFGSRTNKSVTTDLEGTVAATDLLVATNFQIGHDQKIGHDQSGDQLQPIFWSATEKSVPEPNYRSRPILDECTISYGFKNQNIIDI